MRSLLITLLAIVAWSVGPTSLAETTTYRCDYSTYADEDGLHSVKGEFVLTFLMDADTSKAYILGNSGSAEVSMLDSSGGISFIEVTPVGNVMTTAIDPSGKSVHSRNSIMFGELLPSQYYGTCR